MKLLKDFKHWWRNQLAARRMSAWVRRKRRMIRRKTDKPAG